MKVETPIQYMKDLNWNKEDLEVSKKFLLEWDKRDPSFYDNINALSRKADLAEREHMRNCITYWEEELKNT